MEKIKIIEGLVNVIDIDDSLVIDLRYAGENNFLKRKIYPINICILQLETAKKLSKANSSAKKLGYRIKVLDAYRPYYVQKMMWDILPNEEFVAHPNRGSNHNKGAAVDVTLVYEDGREVLMPSEFDEFTEKSNINYIDAPIKAIENRELLADIMVKAGFLRMESEWWHFNDSECNRYNVLNIDFREFL